MPNASVYILRTCHNEGRDVRCVGPQKVEPNESLELIPLDPSRLEALARIGNGMTLEMRHAMQQLLTEH